MRMVHYFAVLALIAVPALLWTAATGVSAEPGSTLHLNVGLVTAMLAVATHTLVILFMIVTGRVLRAAMTTRPLGAEFLAELNVFFAEKRAYPLAILGAFAVVTAAVLGYAQRGFGVSSSVHMLVGIAAVLVNLWALAEEYKALLTNQSLLDRATAELDRLDRESPPEPIPDEAELDPAGAAKRWFLAGLVAWLPCLYWGLIEWKGDFSKVPLWMPLVTLVFSGYAFLCAWLSARDRARTG